MGKIRVTTIGDEEAEIKEKIEKDRKRAEKKLRESQASSTEQELLTTDSTITTEVAAEKAQTEAKESTTGEKTEVKKAKKEKFATKSKGRSTKYTAAAMKVDKNKSYSLSEAIELLKEIKTANFDETVELHINTTEPGISGTMTLPHGTGKETRVAIADDAILAEVEKGKINFDILIATPSQMPKLARVAKVLGPRGLMPNPKNGTISEKPEEAMKKFQGGQMSFKTESKIPIIHLSVGKTSFNDSQLSDNIKTAIQAVKKDKIRKVTLKSTMSPGIRLQV